ncbi:MAG: 4a-hydroxytetrahydrobiopterin dehydratase [Planctomycetota bacterium]|nr:4a-hydroxytetrahydrobiopterin dehydratase [Planctomycetota bacterium]
MNSELAQKECVPCKGGVAPLATQTIDGLLGQIDGWSIEQEYHLAKAFRFANFAEALDFVNRIGAIAEQQNHHPDIFLAWGKVGVEVWTHKINGLTESDFIFAAKIDSAFESMRADESECA